MPFIFFLSTKTENKPIQMAVNLPTFAQNVPIQGSIGSSLSSWLHKNPVVGPHIS